MLVHARTWDVAMNDPVLRARSGMSLLNNGGKQLLEMVVDHRSETLLRLLSRLYAL